MSDLFQGPSEPRALSPDSALRAVTAHATLVDSPDLNYGSNWSYTNPLNAVDGDTGTYAAANAGGGTGSPSYKPAILFTFDSEDLGSGAIYGCKIVYEWTNNAPSFEAGARLDLYWQVGGKGTSKQWDHRLMHQHDALSFLDGVKTTEQYHFEGVTAPIGNSTVFLTLLHTSGISGSSNLTLQIFDVEFLVQDRFRHVNQG